MRSSRVSCVCVTAGSASYFATTASLSISLRTATSLRKASQNFSEHSLNRQAAAIWPPKQFSTDESPTWATTNAIPTSRRGPGGWGERRAIAAHSMSRCCFGTGLRIGAISVARSERDGAARPFAGREIELLQTFADQAVIAIENVRLFT